MRIGYKLTLCLFIAAVGGCASPPPKKQDQFNRRNLDEMKAAAPRPAEPKIPDFSPVSEDISSIMTSHVTITARNTPLGDVLHVIAEASGLNLMINRGVLLDLPITLTLRNVTCENALATIFSTIDYSYTIKDNMLVVEAITTKIFELGHPSLIQGYNVDIGGDILGGAISSSGSGASKSIKGDVGLTAKSDTKAFDFWDSLEKSLNDMLGVRNTPSGSNPATQGLHQTPAAVGQPGLTPSQAEIARASADAARAAALAAPPQEQNVTINRLTGAIVVTASRQNLKMVENYLETLKRILSRQVLVEARIIEVQLTDNLKYGIDWSFLDDVKNIGSLAAGFGALNLPGSSLTNATGAAAPAFRLGLSRSNLQVLLTALKEQGDIKTLSNPRINVMNGQSALLTVGRNFGYISKVSSTTTTTAGSAPTTTFNVETNSILSGMMLGIVPYINSNGEITLTITPIISDLVDLADTKIGGGNNADQVVMQIPTVDLRELSTTVKVRNGEIVVIGGLINTKSKKVDNKIPFLGDIPGLGLLFTRKDNEDSRTELVVLLQPFLVPTYEQPDKP